MNRRSKYVNEKGYTLIEIVMVVVILGVIGGITFQIVGAGVLAFKKSSARKDLYDQGRLAMERMTRELRDAKEITDCSPGSYFSFKVAHPSAYGVTEEIKYQLNGTDPTILERVADGGTPTVLASKVDSFQLGEEEGGVFGVDASDSATANAGATGITIPNYTVAGSDRLMLVGVSIMNAAEDEPLDPPGEAVSSITWNGTNLTIVGSEISTDTDDGRIEIWKLVAPATGTGDVVITFNRAITQEAVAGVVTFTGVDQTDPLGTFASNAGDYNAVATLNIPSASGEIVFGVICVEYEDLTASSGQTEHWNEFFSSTGAAGGTAVATSSSVAMSWDLDPGTGSHWVIGGVSIKASGSSGSIVCAAGGGSISFDAYSTGTASWSSSVSFSHTIGSGSHRLLVVGVSIEHDASGPTVSSITYNGQPLTKIDSRGIYNDYYGRAELWYMLEDSLPSAGTYTIVVNTPSSPEEVIAGAISLDGVAQQAPEAKAESSADYSDTLSTSITTLTDGAWLVDAAHSGMEYGYTPDSGQTERYDRTGDAYTSRLAASTKEVAVAGSTTMGWTQSGANRQAHEVAAFAPAPASSPLVTLKLRLKDPQAPEDEKPVNLRTKVYMRNMQ